MKKSSKSSEIGLQNYAKKKGLSLEKVAWGSEIAKSTLSDIEKGISAPRYTTLLKIAGFLEVKATHLINDEEAILFGLDSDQH